MLMNQRSLRVWRGVKEENPLTVGKNKLAVKNLHVCRYLINFHLFSFRMQSKARWIDTSCEWTYNVSHLLFHLLFLMLLSLF